ncbi:MAG: VCBS domain-containing protein, partial [bacterium]
TYTVDNNNSTVQALRTSADHLYEVFTYTIRDSAGLFSTAQITVTIQGAKDASLAVSDTLMATEAGGTNNATGGSNPTGNVLTNDSMVDTGDTLSVSGISLGTGAPQAGLVGTILTGTYGTFSIQSNGIYSYQVDNSNSVVQSLRILGETVSETFTYSIQDSTGLSSSAQIFVVIRGNNDRIVAVSDSNTAVEASGANNTIAGVNPSGNVLANDTDVDAGDTKTIVGFGAGNLSSVFGGVGSATLGKYGSVTIAADGSYTYTVDNSNASVQALRTNATTLNDVFTYQIEDTEGLSSSAKLTIVISGGNDAPTALSDQAIAQRAGASGSPGVDPSGNVLLNDTDPDNGDTRSVIGISAGIVSQASGNVGSAING